MDLFLDSSTIISVIVKRNEYAVRLWSIGGNDIFINHYVVKEVRRILRSHYRYSDYDIDLAIENIERNTNLLPDPSKNECRKIRITDKSDRPIVYSAMKHDCVLVTEDRLLLKEGRKYVRTMRPEDVPPE